MSRDCAECGDSERSHDVGFGCRVCACPAFVAIGTEAGVRFYGAPQGDGGLKPGVYVAECGDCGDSSGLKASPAARLIWANTHRCKQEADHA